LVQLDLVVYAEETAVGPGAKRAKRQDQSPDETHETFQLLILLHTL